jgi:hypothetical protein
LIDLLLHSLGKMKRSGGISTVTFNIPDNTISVIDNEGTLIVRPINYADLDGIAHYNYVKSLKPCNNDELVYDASFSQKKKFKEICPGAISVANDLHTLLNIFSKLPQDPPMRDRAILTKKEYYRKALIDHLKIIKKNDEEFQFFRGSQRVVLNQIDGRVESGSSLEQPVTKVSIKVQEGLNYSINNSTKNFDVIATKLAENIYQSVHMEVTEQVNKEISRRKELRFHVEMFKAYTRLQAFCAFNLSRDQGETTRTQAKALVVKYFPQISLQNMNLMLQRAPRIYRLLLLANEDWRLLDSLEDLSSCFFKSSMKSAANFEIWINLVKTGEMVDYKEGQNLLKIGKKEMKEAKFDIIKDYFDGVSEEEIIFEEDDA